MGRLERRAASSGARRFRERRGALGVGKRLPRPAKRSRAGRATIALLLLGSPGLRLGPRGKGPRLGRAGGGLWPLCGKSRPAACERSQMGFAGRNFICAAGSVSFLKAGLVLFRRGCFLLITGVHTINCCPISSNRARNGSCHD